MAPAAARRGTAAAAVTAGAPNSSPAHAAGAAAAGPPPPAAAAGTSAAERGARHGAAPAPGAAAAHAVAHDAAAAERAAGVRCGAAAMSSAAARATGASATSAGDGGAPPPPPPSSAKVGSLVPSGSKIDKAVKALMWLEAEATARARMDAQQLLKEIQAANPISPGREDRIGRTTNTSGWPDCRLGGGDDVKPCSNSAEQIDNVLPSDDMLPSDDLVVDDSFDDVDATAALAATLRQSEAEAAPVLFESQESVESAGRAERVKAEVLMADKFLKLTPSPPSPPPHS